MADGSPLWGFAAGLEAAQQSKDQHALTQAQLALAPYQQQEAKQKVQMDAIALQQAEISLKRQQEISKVVQARLQQYMQQGGQQGGGQPGGSTGGTPLTMSPAFTQPIDGATQTFQMFSDLALAEEKPLQAGELLEKSTAIQKNLAEMQVAELNARQKRLEVVAGALQTTSPMTWKQDNFRVAQQIGAPTPFMYRNEQGQWDVRPYDQHAIDLTKAMVDSQDKQARRLLDQARARSATAEAALADKRKTLLDKQVDMEQERIDIEKSKLGPSATVKPATVTAMTNYIISQGVDTTTDPSVVPKIRALALAPAERAEELRRKNPSLPLSDALKQAYEEYDLQRQFSNLPRKPLSMEPPGTEKGGAMPLPKKGQPLEPGTLYQLGDPKKGGTTVWYRPDLQDKYHTRGPFFTNEMLDQLSAAEKAKRGN